MEVIENRWKKYIGLKGYRTEKLSKNLTRIVLYHQVGLYITQLYRLFAEDCLISLIRLFNYPTVQSVAEGWKLPAYISYSAFQLAHCAISWRRMETICCV